MNDEEIIQLFFARNEEAIRQTADKYGARLQRMACNIVQNTQDAEESVSDTYLKAWDTIPPTHPQHYFAYLARICRNFSFGKLDWMNAAKRKAEIIDLTQEMEECIPGTWLEAQMESRELSRIIGAFLRRQSPENRMVFVRRYWYAESVADIAKRYGIQESAVTMRLRRTREKLAAYLKKEGITI